MQLEGVMHEKFLVAYSEDELSGKINEQTPQMAIK